MAVREGSHLEDVRYQRGGKGYRQGGRYENENTRPKMLSKIVQM